MAGAQAIYLEGNARCVVKGGQCRWLDKLVCEHWGRGGEGGGGIAEWKGWGSPDCRSFPTMHAGLTHSDHGNVHVQNVHVLQHLPIYKHLCVSRHLLEGQAFPGEKRHSVLNSGISEVICTYMHVYLQVLP